MRSALIANNPEEPLYQASLENLYGQILGAAQGLCLIGPAPSDQTGRDQETLGRYLRAARLYALVPPSWIPSGGTGGLAAVQAQARIIGEPGNLLILAKKLHAAGRPTEAEIALDRSIHLTEAIPARFPGGEVHLQYCWWQEAQARSLRGLIRWEAGQDPGEDYDRAEKLLAQLTPEEIAGFGAYPDVACLEEARGELLWARGDSHEAAEAFRRAESARRKATLVNQSRQRELAWFLATCPDQNYRRSEEAVALAQKVLTGPKATGSLTWRTLGVAQLRAGNSNAAESLEKGMLLGGGGDAVDWFFLAMAYWQLDEKAKAREWFDKAAAWAEKHRPKGPRLRRLRTEAAVLLAVTDSPPAEEKKALAPKP
jgi:tetratricopeptide (TPR) repeat protein